MPDAPMHPQPCVRKVKARKQVTTGHRLTRHSLRDGFTVSFGLSPEIGLFCLRRKPQCVSIVARLMPASRHQDHTTSPSASNALRPAHRQRPPHPAPNVRDDRDTPLVKGRETGEEVPVICPTAQGDFFP